jgi:hypothetical protein
MNFLGSAIGAGIATLSPRSLRPTSAFDLTPTTANRRPEPVPTKRSHLDKIEKV